jgi:hypothetical protein
VQPEHVCSAPTVGIDVCVVLLPQEVSNSTAHGTPGCKVGRRTLVVHSLKVQHLVIGSSH